MQEFDVININYFKFRFHNNECFPQFWCIKESIKYQGVRIRLNSVDKVVFKKDGAQVEEEKRHKRISVSLATR